MKNAYDVLAQKENSLARVKKELEALRIVAPLLQDHVDSSLQELDAQTEGAIDLPADRTLEFPQNGSS
jgi:hypothetical protein